MPTKTTKTAKPSKQKTQEFTDPKLGMSVRVPSPPPLLDELTQAMEDPNSGMQKFGDLVQKDAGLTASIFRVLSRPVYGLRRPPETVAQAVSIIGLKTLHELVRGISIEAAIYGDSPFYPWFWERANDIAVYASAIAQRQRTVCNIFPEHAHLTALFLDCGVPIMVQHNPDYEKLFTTAAGYVWPDLTVEDGKYNTDHAVVGYLAAKHWRLPAYVCDAIRWHHEPINVDDKAATMVAIQQTATHIYNLYAMKDDGMWEKQKASALEEIGVHPDGLREFEEEIHDRALGL